MSNNIDKIGIEARHLFTDIQNSKDTAKQTRESNRKRVAELKPLLEKIWAAFDAKQSVNGIATKTEWVSNFAKTSIRNCQYILAGGNKNRPEKRFVTVKLGDTVRFGGIAGTFKIAEGEGAISFEKSRKYLDAVRIAVTKVGDSRESQKKETSDARTSFLSRIADVKEKLADIQRQWNAPFKPGEVRDGHLLDQIDPVVNEVFEEFLKLISPDGYEVTPGDRGRWMVQEKWEEEEPTPAKIQAPKKAKTTDPAKDLMKRFRAAKRLAKFYVGMMQEWEAVTRHGKRDYANLLKLWGGEQNGYPWTPPTKDYQLPKTEKEFQTEYDKATAEFHKVLAEGEAAGVLTTAPREKKSKAEMHPAAKEMEETLAAAYGADAKEIHAQLSKAATGNCNEEEL
jgi:hypothetical protein